LTILHEFFYIFRFAENLINKTCSITVLENHEPTDVITSAVYVGGGAFIKKSPFPRFPNRKLFFGVDGISSEDGFDLVIFWEAQYICRALESVIVSCDETVDDENEPEGQVYLMETVNDHRGASESINFQVIGVKPETFLQVHYTSDKSQKFSNFENKNISNF
jgi:hypothetical protein